MGRQLHLNAFLSTTGHHEASWRHAQSSAERVDDVNYFRALARKAESGKLDAIFFADVPVGADTPLRVGHPHEPLTLLSAIAGATEKVGLIATASTTFNEPYNLARSFASLDHISAGRAGWNIVTTFSPAAAQNFGLSDVPSHEERYARAQEFIDVATKLWDSWEDDAVIVDRESGHYYQPGKVHRVDHVGRHYQVRGPLGGGRSPQGRPVYVQAGSSNEGRAFAARNAEAIFTAHLTLSDAQAFYGDIKSRVRSFGRNPDHVLILPGISAFIGDTEQEARELYEEYNALTLPEYGIRQLEQLAGVSLGHVELDERVPLDVFGAAGNVLDNEHSRKQVIANLVERERPTLRELLHRLAGARGHNVVHGTPTRIADQIQEWFEGGAADGFNVMPPAYPQLLDTFIEKVVPILQDRGLFRTEYTGSTLRDHYGLPRPESIYAGEQLARVSGS